MCSIPSCHPGNFVNKCGRWVMKRWQKILVCLKDTGYHVQSEFIRNKWINWQLPSSLHCQNHILMSSHWIWLPQCLISWVNRPEQTWMMYAHLTNDWCHLKDSISKAHDIHYGGHFSWKPMIYGVNFIVYRGFTHISVQFGIDTSSRITYRNNFNQRTRTNND